LAGAPPQTSLGELTALPQTYLPVFKGPTSKGKEGEEEERRKGKGEGKGKGGEGRTTLHTPCRKFLATPLLGPRPTFISS